LEPPVQATEACRTIFIGLVIEIRVVRWESPGLN